MFSAAIFLRCLWLCKYLYHNKPPAEPGADRLKRQVACTLKGIDGVL